jgi:ABC-2 type transport system ATP-binding protein
MIELVNVTKKFGKEKGIFDIDMTFKKGTVYGLIGHNGSGKTTMIKTIMGLYIKDKGKVNIEGVNKKEEIMHTISYLPDEMSFSKFIKVSDLSEFHNAIQKDFNLTTFNELLTTFKVDPSEKFESLSKGQRMAVRLSLALARDVDVYIFDEPLAGIDLVTRQKILDEILYKIDTTDKLIIMSSHELYDIDGFLDEIVVINNGMINGVYEVDEIKEQHRISLHEWYIQEFSSL